MSGALGHGMQRDLRQVPTVLVVGNRPRYHRGDGDCHAIRGILEGNAEHLRRRGSTVFVVERVRPSDAERDGRTPCAHCNGVPVVLADRSVPGMSNGDHDRGFPPPGIDCPECGTPVARVRLIEAVTASEYDEHGQPVTERPPGREATELRRDPGGERLALSPCGHRIVPADHPELTSAWQ